MSFGTGGIGKIYLQIEDMKITKIIESPPNINVNMDLQNGMVGPEPHTVSVAMREITQTDRLNNHLLKSFLERMNSGRIADQFVPQTLSEDADEEDTSADFED